MDQPKFRQGHLVVDLVEHDLDRCSDVNLVVAALEEIGVEPGAFLELDDRHVVRCVVAEGGMRRAVHDDLFARALVLEVNAKRRAIYSKRATESNVPVEEVGKIFANEIAKDGKTSSISGGIRSTSPPVGGS